MALLMVVRLAYRRSPVRSARVAEMVNSHMTILFRCCLWGILMEN